MTYVFKLALRLKTDVHIGLVYRIFD